MDCIFYISGSGTIIVTASNLASQSPNGIPFVFIVTFLPFRCRSENVVLSRRIFFFSDSGQLSRLTPGQRLRREEFRKMKRRVCPARYMTVIAAPDGRFFRRVPREMSFLEFLRPSFHSCPVTRIYGAAALLDVSGNTVV